MLGRDDLGDFALGDVAPFVVAAQTVDHHQLAIGALFQRRQQVRPDEAGAAGYHIHIETLCFLALHCNRILEAP